MAKRGNPARDLMAQLQKAQEELERAKEELAKEMVEVTAGGGAVKIVMSGTQRVHKVEIDPALIAEGDVQMIQDLILLAVNQAIHESQVVAARRLGPITNVLGA